MFITGTKSFFRILILTVGGFLFKNKHFACSSCSNTGLSWGRGNLSGANVNNFDANI